MLMHHGWIGVAKGKRELSFPCSFSFYFLCRLDMRIESRPTILNSIPFDRLENNRWRYCRKKLKTKGSDSQATMTLARRDLTCPKEDQAMHWQPYPSNPKYSSTSLRLMSTLTSSWRMPVMGSTNSWAEWCFVLTASPLQTK